MIAVLALLRGVAANQLVEQALLVIHQGQFAFIELLEELVPAYLFEIVVVRVGALRELDADDTNVAVAVGALYGRRLAALGFRPFANRVMVGRRVRHGSTPFRA